MTIARTPHPVFAALWLAWSVYMIVCVFLPVGWADVVLWGAFALVEGAGVLLKWRWRDTLSEVATWSHRKLVKEGPHQFNPLRGWNAQLFTPYLGLIGLNVWQLHVLVHAPIAPAFAALFACTLCAGLWHHWTQPHIYG